MAGWAVGESVMKEACFNTLEMCGSTLMFNGRKFGCI